jgi:phosphoribosylaminoimidazole-succinocarboxamide synthase
MNLPTPPERALPDRLRRWQAVRVTDLPLELPGYEHVYSGKVRDLYAPLDTEGEVVPDQLLLVASNRLSAYDWMMSPEIPDKGAVLTRLSLWWFDQLSDLVPNHVVSTDVPDAVAGRAVLVRKLDMLKVEAIARAYLTGGGLEEYREKGSVSGVALPEGLVDGSRLPEPVFTPTTKAPVGEHDLPMSPDEVEAELGADVAAEVSRLTRAILARGNEIAAERGILIADTKVEFGVAPDGSGGLVLADEVLTPDSSRFWPAELWEPGHPQPSYDKQFVRDWLTSAESGWDRRAGGPPPELPGHVVDQTRAKYVEAYERLTGERF